MERPAVTTSWFLLEKAAHLRQCHLQSRGFLLTLRTWHSWEAFSVLSQKRAHMWALTLHIPKTAALVLEIRAQSLKKILTLANWQRNKLTAIDNTF